MCCTTMTACICTFVNEESIGYYGFKLFHIHQQTNVISYQSVNLSFERKVILGPNVLTCRFFDFQAPGFKTQIPTTPATHLSRSALLPAAHTALHARTCAPNPHPTWTSLNRARTNTGRPRPSAPCLGTGHLLTCNSSSISDSRRT